MAPELGAAPLLAQEHRNSKADGLGFRGLGFKGLGLRVKGLGFKGLGSTSCEGSGLPSSACLYSCPPAGLGLLPADAFQVDGRGSSIAN